MLGAVAYVEIKPTIAGFTDFSSLSLSLFVFKDLFMYLREHAGTEGAEGGDRNSSRLALSAESLRVGVQGLDLKTLRSEPEQKPRINSLSDCATRAPLIFQE